MPIKVTLPLQGNATITIEGEVDYIKSTLGRIKELTDALGTEVGVVATPPIIITAPTTPMGKTSTAKPTIPAEKKGVLTEAVSALFNNEWGLTPRSFSEIKGALAENAMFRDKGTLAGTLFQLVDQNRPAR